MAELFFQIIAIVFFIAIIKNTGIKRMYWFFVGIIFFPNDILCFELPSFGGMPFPRLIIYSLLLSELIRFKIFKEEIRNFPLKGILLVMLLAFLFIGLTDERLSPILKISRPIFEFTETYFIMVLCYVCIQEESDWKKIQSFIIYASVILCFYGIFNFLNRTNPYFSIIQNTYKVQSYFDRYMLGDPRFRVNSFTFHPIFYGYLLSVFLLATLFSYHYRITSKLKCLAIILLLLINLVFTNSRTPIFVFFIGLIIFLLITMSYKEIFKYGVIFLIMGLFAYNIPSVKELVDNILDIFQTGGLRVGGSSVGVGGSSIGVRLIQLAAAYTEFIKNPIHGNGFRYISENLVNTRTLAGLTSGLKVFGGFESYIYNLLIEQGLTGIFAALIFYLSVLYYFLKRRNALSNYSNLGFTLVIMFLAFSIATGTLDSWKITMGFLGIIVKLIEITSMKATQSMAFMSNEKNR